MKYWLMVVLVLGSTAPAAAQPMIQALQLSNANFLQNRLEFVRAQIQMQMDSLEIQHRIKFDRSQPLELSFDWPDSVDQHPPQVIGYYLPEQRLLLLDRTVVPLTDTDTIAVDSLVWREFRRIMKHELGHVYFMEQSERLGYGNDWLQTTMPKASTMNALVTLKMQAEGAAEVLSGVQPAFVPLLEELQWPDQVTLLITGSTSWQMNASTYYYVGGYQLMRPLVDRFGYKAVVEYTITHPMTNVMPPLAKSLKRWQNQARRDLARKVQPSRD